MPFITIAIYIFTVKVCTVQYPPPPTHPSALAKTDIMGGVCVSEGLAGGGGGVLEAGHSNTLPAG